MVDSDRKKAKDLNQEIINKVYDFERKRTVGNIIKFILMIILIIVFMAYILSEYFHLLNLSQTLDLLELFSEDAEVIGENIVDVVYIFILESPKVYLLTIGLSVIIIGLLVKLLMDNFSKIKNRLLEISKYQSK